MTVRIFRSDRSCLLLVGPLALVLVALGLGGRDLWAPDEPRTGEVVREIALTGSWTVLRDNGRPYLEKPPLYFWLAAAAARVTGRVSEFSLRLPASLAGLAGAVTLFYLGRALFGRRTGALGAVVLLTTQKYFMEARWAHPDMLWSCLLLVACLAFHQGHRAAGDRRWLAGFYLAMGLASLTKGPLGILLPLAAAVVFLAGARDLSFLRRAGLAWGLPLALLPGVLWLAAYRTAAGAPFPLGEGLVRLATRFTQGVHHPRPFAHLATSLPIDLLPWVVFLPGALWHTFPRPGSGMHKDNAYLYSWITVIVAIFAFSAEKRGVYLLPLLPLLSLLVGRVWDTALQGWEPSPVGGTVRWSLFAGLALAVVSSTVFLPRIGRDLPGLRAPAAILAGTALLAVVAAIAVERRLGGGAALSTFSTGLVACYVVIAAWVLPALDPYKSARPFCERVVATVGAAPLGIYPDYRSAYVFYTRRFIDVLESREGLAKFLGPGRRVFCLMEESYYEVERRALDARLHVLDREQVGHRSMLLVSNEPGDAGGASPGGARP